MCQNTKEPPKRISIICNGSRGDYQPYLALGVALKEAGYDVRILSNIAFEKYTNEFGLEHVSLWTEDVEILIKEDPELLEAMANGDVRKMFQCSAKQIKKGAPSIAKSFIEEMTEHRPDLLVMGTFADYFLWYAENVLNLPAVEVKLQSLVCTNERAPMGIPTLPNGGHFELALKMFEGYFDSRAPIDDAMETLNQPTLRSVYTKELFLEDTKRIINGSPEKKIIICQPSLFKDILAPGSNENYTFVGPMIIDSSNQSQPKTFFGGDESENRLNEFLQKDPSRKPVYCGWGSMICKSPEIMIEFVVRALQLSGERGVVLGGFAGLSLELLKKVKGDDDDDQGLITYAEENILFLDKAKHEILFPQMKCIVHHGGAGTFNAAMRAGVPNIITPIFSDQFDHAYIINKLGNGNGFSKQLQKITAEDLGESIKAVVSNSAMTERASELKTKVKTEDGTKAVASFIKEILG